MEDIIRIIKEQDLDSHIDIEDLPDIDLYMDQVIQIFENKFAHTKRYEDEKILTKTMINNYAKGKLFYPIKNKRYSKTHVLLISLIYELKGSLSINDIKAVLKGINDKIINEDFDLIPLYNSIQELSTQNSEEFIEDVEGRFKAAKNEVEKLADKDAEYLEKVLLICSLTNMSQLFRKTAERLVDQILDETKDSNGKH